MSQVALQLHVTKGSSNIIGRSPSRSIIMWFYALDPLMVNYTVSKFGGHSHRGSRYKTVLVWQVISQDHVRKWSSNVMGRSHSRFITILPSWVAIGAVVVEINGFRLASDLARPRDQKWHVTLLVEAAQYKSLLYQFLWP